MIEIPLEPLYVGFLVFLRAGFVLAFFPLVGERFVPARVRLALAAALAVALAPVAGFGPEAFPRGAGAMAHVVAGEALLGFGVGLIGRILFAVMQFAGQLAGEQMGFGLINAIDPTGSHQVSVVAELQYLLAILIFLTADLHHTFLATLARSFEIVPPGGAMPTAGASEYLLRLGSVLFDLSLRLAMPVIAIIFAINVALGLVARAVPQINVFLESFPLRILAGVSVMMLTLGITAALWQDAVSGLETMFGRLLALMAG